MTFGEKFRIPRWCSTFIIFLIFITIILISFTVILPSFQHEFSRLTGGGQLVRENCPSKFRLTSRPGPWTMCPPRSLDHVKKELITDWESAAVTSTDWVQDTAITWTKEAFHQITSWTSWVIDLLLIPFYLFFLLTSLNRMWDFTQSSLIPTVTAEMILRILRRSTSPYRPSFEVA